MTYIKLNMTCISLNISCINLNMTCINLNISCINFDITINIETSSYIGREFKQTNLIHWKLQWLLYASSSTVQCNSSLIVLQKQACDASMAFFEFDSSTGFRRFGTKLTLIFMRGEVKKDKKNEKCHVDQKDYAT